MKNKTPKALQRLIKNKTSKAMQILINKKRGDIESLVDFDTKWDVESSVDFQVDKQNGLFAIVINDRFSAIRKFKQIINQFPFPSEFEFEMKNGEHA